MDHKFYLQRRILILQESYRRFRVISRLLLAVGVLLVGVPFIPGLFQDLALQFAQLGAGIILLLVPIYLNGHLSSKKLKILELEYLMETIEKNSINNIRKDVIMKQILERL